MRRIAIACQGGGSHTAFTAGVLRGLLRAGALGGEHRVVGLSGTSGGAVCALLTWYALRDGEPERAAELLGDFWRENAAASPADRLGNAWMLWGATLQGMGLLPSVSPYDSPVADVATATFRALLERHVDFGRIAIDDAGEEPLLLLGAVDVLSGAFRTFSSRRDAITAETVLASAAIPTLFRSVRVGGELLWDGLFSQNPPVRELLDVEPDDLWVVQINPLELDEEPRTVLAIADRRNELAGNLSLYQELHFIEKIDELLARGVLDPAAGYRQVAVRVIELPREGVPGLGAVSKLDRDPAFLELLMAQGERQAAEFLAALAFEEAFAAGDVDAVAGMFGAGGCLRLREPLEPGEHRGDGLRAALVGLLAREARVDTTRKQVARERVTWALRVGDRQLTARARFEAGRVASLELGA